MPEGVSAFFASAILPHDGEGGGKQADVIWGESAWDADDAIINGAIHDEVADHASVEKDGQEVSVLGHAKLLEKP